MNIRLLSLSLHNFKGIRDLTVILDGRNATVYGPNAAGKTTIVDAFLWLLFNKDSENRGQFEVKTLDTNNRPIHNLEHEVEAKLTVDSRRVTLRKSYKEIWKRPRGKSQQEFDGHTTEYWINEEPVKAKEYNEYVAGLISDEVFRLITNPSYFSVKLHWEARRKMLLDLCGEISTEAVIDAGGELLQGLSDLLGERTVDSARKVLQEKRRRVNDDMTKIPAQIEAVTRTLPELRDDYSDTEAALVVCKEEIEDLDAQMQNASRALEPTLEKGRLLARLEREQGDIAARLERESRDGYYDARQNRERFESQLRQQNSFVESTRGSLGRLKAKLVDADTELKNLRADHEREYQTTFSEPTADEYICRSCGQELPAGKRAELLNDAKSRFESKKTTTLNSIESKGLQARRELEALQSDIEKTEKELDKAIKDRDATHSSCEAYRLVEQQLTPTGEVDYAADPQYAALGTQIAALYAELDTPAIDSNGDIKAKRAAVNARMEGLMKELSARDAAVKSRAVIAEYTAKERQLSDQLTELDGQLFMLETYVRTEAELLETSVNAKFKTISFRLFEEQINGGLRPTCEAVIGGVQYSEANTASQINAGMEIIDALCAHYGVYAPVFVDRCESINQLAHIESQVIRMIVVRKEDMQGTLALPGAVLARAARSDVCIQLEVA